MEKITPSGFYVFHRPLLPIEIILNLFDQTENGSRFETHLRNTFSHPHLQEAIYLASPDLFLRLQDWLHHSTLLRKFPLKQKTV